MDILQIKTNFSQDIKDPRHEPVNTVSSPSLWPFKIRFSSGNLFHFQTIRFSNKANKRKKHVGTKINLT
jgi:hypothetical protein